MAAPTYGAELTGFEAQRAAREQAWRRFPYTHHTHQARGTFIPIWALELGARDVLPRRVSAFFVSTLAIVADIRTRRGYGLGILSFLVLALTALVFVATITARQQREQLAQQQVMYQCGTCALSFFYFFPELFATLALVIAAAIVASIGGQWRWFVGLVVAALLPALASMLPLSS